MARSSVQVSDATRSRLANYKSAGLSYDDILGYFMDALPPDHFHAALAAGRQAIARHLAPAPPGGAEAGMEEALRLFRLRRER